MYQILHIMMNEQSEVKFQEIFQIFLDKYKTTEPEFYRYFEDYYISRTGNIDFIIPCDLM